MRAVEQAAAQEAAGAAPQLFGQAKLACLRRTQSSGAPRRRSVVSREGARRGERLGWARRHARQQPCRQDERRSRSSSVLSACHAGRARSSVGAASSVPSRGVGRAGAGRERSGGAARTRASQAARAACGLCAERAERATQGRPRKLMRAGRTVAGAGRCTEARGTREVCVEPCDDALCAGRSVLERALRPPWNVRGTAPADSITIFFLREFGKEFACYTFRNRSLLSNLLSRDHTPSQTP